LTAAASARLLPENDDDIMVVEEQEEAKGQQLQMVQKQKSEEQENKETKNTKISNKKKDQIPRSARQRGAKNLTNNIETDQTHDEEEDLKLVDKGTKKKLKQDLEARNQFENDKKTSFPPAEEEDLMLKDSKDSNKASSSKANSRSY